MSIQLNKKTYHGINLSLGSIRNQGSSGIGEYLDLIPLIEWTSSIGFDIIQLLPLNDSGGDSSPYSALSAQALHPIYISLWALPHLELMPDAEAMLIDMRRCNSSKRFNYHAVLKAKIEFLSIYFEYVFEKVKELPAFKKFVLEQPWLSVYALFKTLKQNHSEVAWWEWEKQYQKPTPELFLQLKAEFQDHLDFHTMVQFFAFNQMQSVKRTAAQHKILIKGDIPILINRDSADVWNYQDGFTLDMAAGAPPDMYNSDGQYWGFPLYNWSRHEADGFSWWKQRLHVAEKLYDMYRIDHIVGFFRIWAIPLGKIAKDGSFLPADQALWIPQGQKILQMMLDASKMVPIGEDLGAVSDEVRICMQKLGIAGTKVMRWERRWHTDQSYIPSFEYPRDSMTTISTHDSETFVEWWDKAGDDAIRFAHDFQLAFESPILPRTLQKSLRISHTTASHFHINLLQEYLAVFPELRWHDAADERINIPGLVMDSNWTYRFMPFLDTIISHERLTQFMKSLSQ